MVTEFTPWASFGGGLLIGLAAVLLMAGLGRIFGATGIVSGFVFADSREEFAWRAALVVGMLIAPALVFLTKGQWPTIDVPVSPLLLVVGGLIVGIGTSLGSGCTSGHGVCGLSRLSGRSLVAVPVFMTTAAVTVYISRHVLGA